MGPLSGGDGGVDIGGFGVGVGPGGGDGSSSNLVGRSVSASFDTSHCKRHTDNGSSQGLRKNYYFPEEV